VLLSFYVLSLLIVKVSHLADKGCGAVKLDKIDHSSSEKKSFSSYLPSSRSATNVKGSVVLRSQTRCLRSP
jgi:hypothetical protein